jgi:dTDP-glucose 4,6-dehydratase
MKLLVTGGAGFIGSAFVRHRLGAYPDDRVTVLDKLTYAGRRENLEGLPDERLELVVGDIADRDAVHGAIAGCDAVVNFAAESHVDRSIESPGEFIVTDVFGTYVLLEAARDAGIRHLQVSTDEVYGSIEEGSFTEASPIEPSSPYSASKAGGDLLVRAFNHTYGADALVCRASNNYGPRQYPEKLIPLCVLNALAGDPLPVYGDGMQVRNWLHVDDHCTAISAALERGEAGEVYNVGGPDELPNIDVVRRILELTGRDESLIEYVRDRPGHDRRYSLSSERTEGLGWEAAIGFDEGLARTVDWYRDNEDWWAPIRSGDYRAYYERHYGKALGAAETS